MQRFLAAFQHVVRAAVLRWLLIDVHEVLLVCVTSALFVILATCEELLCEFESVLLVQVFLLH